MKIYRQSEKLSDVYMRATQKRFCGISEPHGHEYFEMEFILGGSGSYEIDGKTYEIQKNTLFLMTPANIHAVRDADVELINVVFQSDLLAFPLLSASYSSVFFLQEEEAVFLRLLLQRIVEMQRKDAHYARLLLECFFKELSLFVDPVEGKENGYSQKAILYMLAHFRSRMTLESTAAHLGLSPSYLSEVFVKETGMGFKEYLDGIRFSYAKNLISFTDHCITSIHGMSGFCDYANFARRFKQKYRMTPTEFRVASRKDM